MMSLAWWYADAALPANTTVRGTALAELEAMTPRYSQWLPGEEIPEKHWMYKVAKRYFYHDFGVYKQLDPKAKSPIK